MQGLDCVLVHVPKWTNYYPPLHLYSSLHWMSHGLFGLADGLHQADHTCKILHLGMERALDPSFSLAGYVNHHQVAAVGFSMHFHQQIADTIAAARELARTCPDVFILLGGMSASYFSSELLEKYPFIHAVITGEGNQPLQALIAARKTHPDNLDAVPNLVWRKEGAVISNAAIYVSTQKDLDDVSHTNLSYLEHHEHYLNFPKAVLRTRLPHAFNFKLSQKLQSEKRNFFGGLLVGRGCHDGCFYCGGGAEAQKRINHRTGVVFRSVDRVLASLRELKSYGFTGTHISFDPHPQSQSYYIELFQKMRAEGLEFDLNFSAWGLPSRAFLEEFGRTFSARSSVSISPETGSEKLRLSSRDHHYTNAALMETLQTAEANNVNTTVFFSLGIPHETREDFTQTLALSRQIKKRFKRARVKAFVIEIEPAAPWHLHPEKFGIELIRKSLDDFITQQSNPYYSSMRHLGFYKKDFLGEAVRDADDYARRLLRLKCRYFCEERRVCPFLRAFWAVSRSVGISLRPETLTARKDA